MPTVVPVKTWMRPWMPESIARQKPISAPTFSYFSFNMIEEMSIGSDGSFIWIGWPALAIARRLGLYNTPHTGSSGSRNCTGSTPRCAGSSEQ